MSYDFQLFKRKSGENPHETGRAGPDGLPSTPPEPQKEALKRKVADALIAHNSQLEVFQFDYAAIAKSQKITEEQARIKFRYLELNGPEEDCNGIQITLFDDEASVKIPFWHEDNGVAEIFREVWSYLEIISRETGYLIYDPQIDRVIEPSAGFDDALACYSRARREIRKTLPMNSSGRRPWWRFW